jgi:hypothetical protein
MTRDARVVWSMRSSQIGISFPTRGYAKQGIRIAERLLERQAPYPELDSRRPARLAFVGQETYFGYCALSRPTSDVVPAFIDFRSGADPGPMLAALRSFEPDVVLTFRPEVFPEGCFQDLPAVIIGYLTEPLPRSGAVAHPDLARRLEYLEALDASNFDRILTFDPLIAESVDPIAPVWRSLPLPVSDDYFAPATRGRRPVAALFTGRSTEHRELFLGRAKHEHDVIHVVHGITDDRLRQLLAETDVGVNLHNENYPTFENRCAVYLAAGNLLVTEPISPTHGLEPGLDYLEVTVPEELERVLYNASQQPDAYRRIRIRGRMKAEYFRASRVYPRLVRDALLDVAVFGSPRRGAAAPNR